MTQTQQEQMTVSREATRELAMARVVAELQLLLAARRSARFAQRADATHPAQQDLAA